MDFTFTGEFQKIDTEDKLYIYGPASAEILDSQGDIIKMEAIKKALPQLLKRARVTVDHKDQIVGEIIESYTKADLTYKTEVRLPTDGEILKFAKLNKDKEALFVLAEIWNDTKYCSEVRTAIERGQYRSYSISGNVVNSRPCKSDEKCARIVSDLNLSAVTICRSGANPAAQFDILKEEDKMTDEAKEAVIETAEVKPELVTKGEFEALKAEMSKPLSKLDEIYELIKKKEEVKEEPIVAKEEPKVEAKPEPKAPEPESIKIDVEKIKAELKEELLKEIKNEYKPVQVSAGTQPKKMSHQDIMNLLRH